MANTTSAIIPPHTTVEKTPNSGDQSNKAHLLEDGSRATLQSLRSKFERYALGELPYDPHKGLHSYRVGTTTHEALIYLQLLTGQNRKTILSIAVMEYLRMIISRPITSQNDMALFTQGLQFAVHDLALELQVFSELALSVAEQETLTQDSDQRL